MSEEVECIEYHDGYPTDEALQKIRDWDVHDWRRMLAAIEPYFERMGRWTRTQRRLEIATGGWSGNEDIVEAMDRSMFGILAWESSHRGGMHRYDLTRVSQFSPPR